MNSRLAVSFGSIGLAAAVCCGGKTPTEPVDRQVQSVAPAQILEVPSCDDLNLSDAAIDAATKAAMPASGPVWHDPIALSALMLRVEGTLGCRFTVSSSTISSSQSRTSSAGPSSDAYYCGTGNSVSPGLALSKNTSPALTEACRNHDACYASICATGSCYWTPATLECDIPLRDACNHLPPGSSTGTSDKVVCDIVKALTAGAYINQGTCPSSFPACLARVLRVDGQDFSSKKQGDSFSFTGKNFGHNEAVRRWVKGPSGTVTEILPTISADADGNFAWTGPTGCASATGAYTLWATSASSAIPSNEVTQWLHSNPSCTAPTPAPSPIDASEFVSQLVADGTTFAPGTNFTQEWHLRNIGNTTWNAYSAVFVPDAHSGNASMNLTTPSTTSLAVSAGAPSQTVTVSASLRAPTEPGTYYSYWQLKNSAGTRFGTQFYIKIVVSNPNVPVSSPAITTEALAQATVGSTYSQGVNVSGGQPPYNWSIGTGFPAGLTINTATGIISGAPTTAGNYSFVVTVQDGSTPQKAASKTFSIVVNPAPPGPTPTIGLSSSAMTFTAPQGGGSPIGQPLTITNTGTGTFNWSASASAAWLSLSSMNGTVPASPSVFVNVSGLAAGTYSGTITIAASGAVNSPRTVSVTFVVTALPEPIVSTQAASNVGQTSFRMNGSVIPNGQPTSGYFEFGTNSALNSYDVTNAVSFGSGSSAVPLSFDRTAVACNTNYYYRTVAVTTGANAVVVRGSIVTVTTSPCPSNSAPTIGLSAATMTFTAPQGGGSPLGQVVNISNTGGSSLVWSASVNTNWLSLSSTGGTAPSSPSVFVNVGSLTAGTYTGTITVTATGASNSPRTVTVTFVVTASGSAPAVTTGSAGSITTTQVMLFGAVNPNNLATTYLFQYGPTTSYGSTSGTSGAGSGGSTQNVSMFVGGLTLSTIYHYRIAATNSVGTSYGADAVFTTSSGAGGSAPTVTTGVTGNVTATDATPFGTINPNGLLTSYWFQFGTTTSYGRVSGTYEIGSGTSILNISAYFGGLSPNTTYHYRIVGTNSAGTANGADATFTTRSGVTNEMLDAQVVKRK